MKTTDQHVLNQIAHLQDRIAHYNHMHFVKEIDEIGNEEFDALVCQLNKLKEDYPDEAKVAENDQTVIPMEATGTELEVTKFNDKMLSLSKVYNQDELKMFYRRMPEGATYNYEYKLDGLALELNYVFGILTEILTRYDGSNGELVTHALPLFGNIPLEIPEWENLPNRRVRGEGFITYEAFERYNQIAVSPAKNTRNSVAGWVRALPENQNPLVKGMLSYNVYWCDDHLGQDTYDNVMEELVKLGFTRAPKINELFIQNNVRSQIFPVDGVVIKVDNLKLQKELGERSNSPRWAIAYKFPAERAVTTLIDVLWQVGRTGAVTPVLLYSPVMLMGAECTRATLFNYRQFNSHSLRIGSKITICRTGDVIPHLLRVEDAGKGPIVKAPKNCPSCNSLLSYDGENNEQIHLRCYNVSGCPAQLIQRCYNLVDKDGLDVDGIGLVTIEKWIQDGLIKNPADIFQLPESVMNPGLWKRLHAAKTVPLNKFIKALSLPGVGKVTAMNIAKAITGFMSLKEKDDVIAFLQHCPAMCKVADVGVGTAFDVSLAVQDPQFVKMYNALMDVVTLVPMVIDNFSYKVAVTGTASVPRGELEELFKQHNIELTNKVSKDCKSLLIGSKPSLSKINNANKFNIPIVDIAEVSDLQDLIKKVLA